MFFSTKPIPVYSNDRVETLCYNKSDTDVLQWLNSTTAMIRRLQTNPDPGKDPKTALVQLKEKATILESIWKRRGLSRGCTGTTTEDSAKKRKTSSSPIFTAMKTYKDAGTQTDPWVCPDCNGNPDLEEEKFVFNELACNEDYIQ